MHAGMQRLLAGVPSAVFAPSQPGRRYGPVSRLACVGVKFLEYSLAGIVCGLVGQGIANALIRFKCAPQHAASCTLEYRCTILPHRPLCHSSTSASSSNSGC